MLLMLAVADSAGIIQLDQSKAMGYSFTVYFSSMHELGDALYCGHSNLRKHIRCAQSSSFVIMHQMCGNRPAPNWVLSPKVCKSEITIDYNITKQEVSTSRLAR